MQPGVQIRHPDQLSGATPQSGSMQRLAAVSAETTGSQNLWMGRVTTPAGMVSAWHHHGDCETGIYVVQGRARFRWGAGGRESAEVGAGDFLAVAPGAIHQEETLGDEAVVLIVARSCSGIIVVNVDGPAPDRQGEPA
ncbi:MAG TPA: cupin domain-containing protein [Chloroflexia bacterium]|nr:cupin domain-containing protein [Chloroflexia bacterium]